VIGDILQPTHLLFILVIALIVLGPKRLPEVGRSLGKGLRDFRGAISGQDEASPEQSVQHLQSGEGQAAPPPGPAGASAEQPVGVSPDHSAPPQEPAGVSADQGDAPQEPASVSAEHGSSGSA
jgi:sec-independent protein translocase protein TatA